jgi:GrpB-like predicted nucleotidyltransferase (UPF0157 family)
MMCRPLLARVRGVAGAGPMTDVRVVSPNVLWPVYYETVARAIIETLGDVALSVEHIGSTAVPGLPAKPVIDIDLTVADARDEDRYVPALERHGFELVVREPWWYEHRCLYLKAPRCTLHVFSPDCAEAERHRIFRDWLRSHPADRSLYADAKVAAARATCATGGNVMDYNERKESVVREIYARAFRALGLLG